VIEITGLSVRFGGVVSIDDMSVTFPGGTCGLIGPNGAGKTTFFNVLSGFVTPQAGRVTAFGDDLLALPDFRRARWGLRRTFQTEQAIESLTVFDNVLMVHEHTSHGGRTAARDAVLQALHLTGLGDKRNKAVGGLPASDRRLVEVARAIVGTPRLILLDEPAAGLPEDETEHLAVVIKEIPTTVGATVIVVEHDMSLVQACCETIAVLDFGRLLASGPTAEVLHDPRVLEAYLGVDESVR
jgi:branched-chain amino acid transport system ATP-binding protein